MKNKLLRTYRREKGQKQETTASNHPKRTKKITEKHVYGKNVKKDKQLNRKNTVAEKPFSKKTSPEIIGMIETGEDKLSVAREVAWLLEAEDVKKIIGNTKQTRVEKEENDTPCKSKNRVEKTSKITRMSRGKQETRKQIPIAMFPMEPPVIKIKDGERISSPKDNPEMARLHDFVYRPRKEIIAYKENQTTQMFIDPVSSLVELLVGEGKILTEKYRINVPVGMKGITTQLVSNLKPEFYCPAQPSNKKNKEEKNKKNPEKKRKNTASGKDANRKRDPCGEVMRKYSSVIGEKISGFFHASADNGYLMETIATNIAGYNKKQHEFVKNKLIHDLSLDLNDTTFKELTKTKNNQEIGGTIPVALHTIATYVSVPVAYEEKQGVWTVTYPIKQDGDLVPYAGTMCSFMDKAFTEECLVKDDEGSNVTADMIQLGSNTKKIKKTTILSYVKEVAFGDDNKKKQGIENIEEISSYLRDAVTDVGFEVSIRGDNARKEIKEVIPLIPNEAVKKIEEVSRKGNFITDGKFVFNKNRVFDTEDVLIRGATRVACKKGMLTGDFTQCPKLEDIIVDHKFVKYNITTTENILNEINREINKLIESTTLEKKKVNSLSEEIQKYDNGFAIPALMRIQAHVKDFMEKTYTGREKVLELFNKARYGNKKEKKKAINTIKQYEKMFFQLLKKHLGNLDAVIQELDETNYDIGFHGYVTMKIEYLKKTRKTSKAPSTKIIEKILETNNKIYDPQAPIKQIIENIEQINTENAKIVEKLGLKHTAEKMMQRLLEKRQEDVKRILAEDEAIDPVITNIVKESEDLSEMANRIAEHTDKVIYDLLDNITITIGTNEKIQFKPQYYLENHEKVTNASDVINEIIRIANQGITKIAKKRGRRTTTKKTEKEDAENKDKKEEKTEIGLIKVLAQTKKHKEPMTMEIVEKIAGMQLPAKAKLELIRNFLNTVIRINRSVEKITSEPEPDKALKETWTIITQLVNMTDEEKIGERIIVKDEKTKKKTVDTITTASILEAIIKSKKTHV